MNPHSANRPHRVSWVTAYFVVALGLLGVTGCPKAPMAPEGPADQAVVHTQQGNQLLEQGKYAEAVAEYDRALALNPKYSPADAGRSIALAGLGRRDDALKALDAADDHADGDVQELGAGVAAIRVHSLLRDDDWLDHAVEAFEDHQRLAESLQSAELHTWMGRAYLAGGKLKKATTVLEAGLRIQRDYPPAREALKAVNTAREALAGMPEEYLTVATAPAINRADVAAIFVAELKLDRLLDKQGFTPKSDFRSPDGRANSTVRRETTTDPITDVDGHWARPMIEKMVSYQVMDAVNGKFDPSEKITKIEFAMLLDGIITKVTGEKATKGLGGDMIFSDVQPEHYGSAAVILVTSRGFLAARPDGRFGSDDPVSGAVALDSVRKIRDFFQSRYNW